MSVEDAQAQYDEALEELNNVRNFKIFLKFDWISLGFFLEFVWICVKIWFDFCFNFFWNIFVFFIFSAIYMNPFSNFTASLKTQNIKKL